MERIDDEFDAVDTSVQRWLLSQWSPNPVHVEVAIDALTRAIDVDEKAGHRRGKSLCHQLGRVFNAPISMLEFEQILRSVFPRVRAELWELAMYRAEAYARHETRRPLLFKLIATRGVSPAWIDANPENWKQITGVVDSGLAQRYKKTKELGQDGADSEEKVAQLFDGWKAAARGYTGS